MPITMICIDKNNENHHEVIIIMIMIIGTIGIRKKNIKDLPQRKNKQKQKLEDKRIIMMIPITMIYIDKNNENHHEAIMIMMIMMMIGTIGIRKKNNNDDTDNNDMHR